MSRERLLFRDPHARFADISEFAFIDRREFRFRGFLRSLDARLAQIERVQDCRFNGFVHRRGPS